jgi:hypothetical protein
MNAEIGFIFVLSAVRHDVEYVAVMDQTARSLARAAPAPRIFKRSTDCTSETVSYFI